MQTVFAPRASTILYDLLVSRKNQRPFLLPANICPIVPITFFKANIPFEFIDISSQTLHMDLDQAETRLRRQKDCYGGILYTHPYGDPATPQDFFRDIKAQFPDLMLIDDRCLCVPDLEPVLTSAADIVLYSTGYAKIVDLEIGGFAFIREDVNYQHFTLPFHHKDLKIIEASYKRSLENHEPYLYVDSNWLETDSNLPPWPDYAEHVRIARDATLVHRGTVNAVYNSLIPSELCLPDKYQLWRFNLRVPDPREILDAIFDARLFASSHYASLAGIMSEGSCPNAYELSRRVINLFNDSHYTVQMAEKTARIILRSL